MAKKFADKGLTVLAITQQSKADVEPFVDEHGATHPIVCESTNSARAYGAKGYPSSYLVGPNGRILWSGRPEHVQDEKIEATLAATKILPTLTKGLSAHAKSLEKQKYGAVLAKVDADLKAARFAEGEDKTVATALQEWLTWYATTAFEAADALAGKGEAYRAYLALSDVEDVFKGHALSAQAKASIGKLKADAAHALEIKAGLMLDAIRKDLGDERDREKIEEALKPLLAKKYAETKAGKDAAALAAGREPEKPKDEPADDPKGEAKKEE